MNKVVDFLRTNLFIHDVEDPEVYSSCRAIMESSNLSPIELELTEKILDMFSELRLVALTIKEVDTERELKVMHIPTCIFTTAEQVFMMLTTCRMLNIKTIMHPDGTLIHITKI